MSLSQLQNLFVLYSAFGSRHATPSPSTPIPSRSRPTSLVLHPSPSSLESQTLDSSKFLKLCKDAKVIDGKKIKASEVDLVFAKSLLTHPHEGVASHGRKLNWEQFLEAVRMLGEMKFGSEALKERDLMDKHGSEEEEKVNGEQLIKTDKTPEPESTGSSSQPIELGKSEEKQVTEKSSQAEPFDPFQQMVSLMCSHVVTLSNHQPSSPTKPYLTGKFSPSVPSSPTTPSIRAISLSAMSRSSTSSGRSIWDKLTDLSSYPHTHRERFNPDGTGRGIAGREDLETPPLADLSKICDRSPSNIRGVPIRHCSATASTTPQLRRVSSHVSINSNASWSRNSVRRKTPPLSLTNESVASSSSLTSSQGPLTPPSSKTNIARGHQPSSNTVFDRPSGSKRFGVSHDKSDKEGRRDETLKTLRE